MPSLNHWHFTEARKGKTLVFLHGWSFDSTIWKQSSEHFCQTHRVVAFDLPGHGQSNFTRGQNIANDFSDIIRKLSADPIVLVGHSFGGFLALDYASQHPQQVEKLILIGTPARFARSQDYPLGLTEEEIKRLRNMLQGNYPEILSVFIRWLFTQQERKQDNFRVLWNQLTQRTIWPDRNALDYFLTLIAQGDKRSVLSYVKIPVLLMIGENDPICSKEAALFLQKNITNARLELFEGCGHLPFLTQANRFCEILEEFIR